MANFSFAILDSSGNPTSTTVDFQDMFAKKDYFLNNGLFTFGTNSTGQLGNNLTSNQGPDSPVSVGSLTTWKYVAAGEYTSYAIKTDGTLWAWGSNTYGQLGNGTTTSYSSPIQIGSLTNWKIIDGGGNHVVALKNDDTLWTWGDNTYGQLGIGYPTFYSSPVQVGVLTNWKQVCGGTDCTFAIKTDGTLWAWGYNNNGRFGNGSNTTSYSSPIQIGSLTTWKYVSTTKAGPGQGYTLAIQTNGTLWAMGYNGVGQLGIGATGVGGPVLTPTQVGSLTEWKYAYAGTYDYSFGIKNDGTLWAWGENGSGQLGLGDTTDRSSPVQVGSLTYWKSAIGLGQSNANAGASLALQTDGTLWAWGTNTNNTVGTVTSSPIQIGSLTSWKQISGGNNFRITLQSPDLP